MLSYLASWLRNDLAPMPRGLKVVGSIPARHFLYNVCFSTLLLEMSKNRALVVLARAKLGLKSLRMKPHELTGSGTGPEFSLFG